MVRVAIRFRNGFILELDSELSKEEAEKLCSEALSKLKNAVECEVAE